MNVMHRIERALCTLYLAMTYPIIALGNVWLLRIEGMERPAPRILSEPTVADITPAGFAEVRAMGADGHWTVLHDYPVRLLPKMPGIEIRRGE